MTVREKLKDMLIQRGMFEDQAKEVIELSILELNKDADDYKITFDASSDVYPDGLYAAMFITIRPIALKWIDDNKPRAWFRPMFV